jgi:hypothetical protein
MSAILVAYTVTVTVNTNYVLRAVTIRHSRNRDR